MSAIFLIKISKGKIRTANPPLSAAAKRFDILETNDLRLDVKGKLLNRIGKGEDFCCVSDWIIFKKPCTNQVLIN